MKKYLIIGAISFTLMATTVYALTENKQNNENSNKQTYNESCTYHNEDCPYYDKNYQYHNEDCPYHDCPYYNNNNCTDCEKTTNSYYYRHKANGGYGHHSRNMHN